MPSGGHIRYTESCHVFPRTGYPFRSPFRTQTVYARGRGRTLRIRKVSVLRFPSSAPDSLARGAITQRTSARDRTGSGSSGGILGPRIRFLAARRQRKAQRTRPERRRIRIFSPPVPFFRNRRIIVIHRFSVKIVPFVLLRHSVHCFRPDRARAKFFPLRDIDTGAGSC